jgi:hypothetical protein
VRDRFHSITHSTFLEADFVKKYWIPVVKGEAIQLGRLTEFSKTALVYEMHRCGVEFADTLHITSWDADHCNMHELQELLGVFYPRNTHS